MITRESKILLFTHAQDIDGMGSIVSGKLAFPYIDDIPCETFEITAKVEEKILDHTIYDYDYVFVTDLCVKEPILSKINNDSNLKQKFLILDHHKSEIEEGNNKYDFVQIMVSKEYGLCSGTKLFYEYLMSHNLLDTNPCIEEFVELTRQYDTWEWKSRFQNEKARILHVLFEEKGKNFYIAKILNILKTKRNFEFDVEQMDLVRNFDEELLKNIDNILKSMFLLDLTLENKNYKIGFVKIPYKYRNELEGFMKKENPYDIDVIGMIMTNKDTVSYRTVKDVDASKIAVYFGGKGHKNAATNLQNNEKFKKILRKMKHENLII